MLGSLKRKRILRERAEAVPEREAAARSFVAAIKDAEAAMEALKAANDKLYYSDVQAEAAALSDLRRSRERNFAFHAAKEVIAQAPRLARLLGLRVAPVHAMPLIEWTIHTGELDLCEVGNATLKGAEA